VKLDVVVTLWLKNSTIFKFTEFERMKIIYPVDRVNPVILSKIFYFTPTIRYRAEKYLVFYLQYFNIQQDESTTFSACYNF